MDILRAMFPCRLITHFVALPAIWALAYMRKSPVSPAALKENNEDEMNYLDKWFIII